MIFEEHMKESILKFNKPYIEVHNWLDEYFHDPKYHTHHRRKRHHLKGIEEVREKWGNEAAEAARLHIESDLKQEGWNSDKDRFPKDEQDYIRMGFW